MAISYRAAQTLIKRGDEASLRLALDQNLSPNLVNDNGWTLLMLTAVEGSVPLGRLLMERGADPLRVNRKGENALTIATHRGYSAFTAMIQEHDAGTPQHLPLLPAEPVAETE